jgi:solute carrier family 25 protein 34/35
LNGVLDALLKTARHDGVLSLQKGLVPALYFQIVMNGIRLGMYDNVK